MQMGEKVGKSRNTVFFQWIVAPEGRKVGSLKRWVRSQLARWEMKNCTPLWREAHFQVKMYKTPQDRTTFGSLDVEKVHAVVARSTFPSQNVQNTSGSDHFWKLRCRKSARRCGAKHISKWKCIKHTIVGPLLEVEMSEKRTPLWHEAHFEVKMLKKQGFGPLLEVQMSQKCTPLWREAHFEVNMLKTQRVRTTFGRWDVQKVHAVVARSTFRSQKCKKLRGTEHFWTFRCRFAWQAQGIVHLVKSEQKREGLVAFSTTTTTTPHYTPIHYTQLHSTLHYTTLPSTTLHYTTLPFATLHHTTLHYLPLHYITLHSTTLHYTTLPSTTLPYITLHYTYNYNYNYTITQLHATSLHYTKLHYTTLNYTTLHYIILHYTTLHHTTLHYTSLHYLPLHFTTLHYTTLHYTTTTLHYTPLH